MIGRVLGGLMALITFAFVWAAIVRSAPTTGVWIGWLPAGVMAVIAGVLTVAFWGALTAIALLTVLLMVACRAPKGRPAGAPKRHQIAPAPGGPG